MNSAKLYKSYNFIIKTVIIVAAAFFIAKELFIDRTAADLIQSLSDLISKNRFLLFLIPVIVLMPINWLLEALKWRQIVNLKESISVFTSLKAVFAGATISSISINRTGEFLGRIFVLRKHSFWEGAVVTIVGSLAQTWNTLFWGGISLFMLSLPLYSKLSFINSILYLAFFILYFISLLVALFFYYRVSQLSRFVPQRFRRVHKAIDVLVLVDSKTLNKVLLYSILRYIVFSFQFYILMIGANISLNVFSGLALISVMFLFNTIRPSIALVEVGLRSASAFLVFEYYFISILGLNDYPQIEIATVTSFIWLINIVLPSIIGLVFIKDLRFFKKEKGEAA